MWTGLSRCILAGFVLGALHVTPMAQAMNGGRDDHNWQPPAYDLLGTPDSPNATTTALPPTACTTCVTPDPKKPEPASGRWAYYPFTADSDFRDRSRGNVTVYYMLRGCLRNGDNSVLDDSACPSPAAAITPGCYIDTLGYGCCADIESIGIPNRQMSYAPSKVYGSRYWTCVWPPPI